ncbi:MAG: RnfABCDGE type electron transport complex subunit D [Alphaproteobacteria bacterium]|nr:RnfABCDGE type electron transport complex subunit D [Alphaproteobacteria bacterium]NNF70708.1 hypothetical protein [Paracoccaceae bacterium]
MSPLSKILSGKGADGVVIFQSVAIIPPLAVILWERGTASQTQLVAALVVVLVWDALFSVVRGQRIAGHGITTAAIFVVFAPPELALWQLAVALSLGTVIGELIFGGRGFAFLGAATVALATLLLSFPDLSLSDPGQAVAIATLPGAALLLVTGLLPWRVAGAFLVVLAAAAFSAGQLLGFWLFGSAVFALVFLVADPAASSVTPIGRLAQGALAAILAALFNDAGWTSLQPEALVYAALLASIFAPLLDVLAVALNGLQRRRRHV